MNVKTPYQAIEQGIGFITEDRKDEGLVLDFSIRDNVVLPSLKSFAPKGIIKDKNEQTFVEMLVKRLTVKTESINSQVGSLSGGNQQKVVIAKWVGIGPKVLIMDEPTRGVDCRSEKRNLSIDE